MSEAIVYTVKFDFDHFFIDSNRTYRNHSFTVKFKITSKLTQSGAIKLIVACAICHVQISFDSLKIFQVQKKVLNVLNDFFPLIIYSKLDLMFQNVFAIRKSFLINQKHFGHNRWHGSKSTLINPVLQKLKNEITWFP